VAAPVSSFALAGLGMLGNLLIILFLSLYMVLDRDRILAFGVRLVPPQYAEEFRLFERSVSRSFGGFLRGQAIMGLLYGALAAVLGAVLGLQYTPVVAAASGILQAIPFFGPFVSWAPPVIDAILTQPTAVVPALVVMAAGWMIVMNVVQPRLMAGTVGIHPLVVLGSVIVGGKVAGIAGAIFGIPVAAVISSFFFYYLSRATADPRTVAVRAARRVAQREGHQVRVPVPPTLVDSLTEVHARADLEELADEGGPDDDGAASAGPSA
jgi:predicted PurR-regulated permease PerM